MKYTWDYYAKLARNIAKRINTGDETMPDGTRCDKARDIQDINASAALSRKYSKLGSRASVHGSPGTLSLQR